MGSIIVKIITSAISSNTPRVTALTATVYGRLGDHEGVSPDASGAIHVPSLARRWRPSCDVLISKDPPEL